MNKRARQLLSVFATLVFVSGCSGVISSNWFNVRSSDSSHFDDIDPESRLLLEAALNNGFPIESSKSRATRLPGIPQQDSPEISRFVDYYSSGPGRKTLQAGLLKRSQYAPLLSGILAEEGLPSEFVNLPLIESSYNTEARSPSGAVGMWQFMRDTARQYGLRVGFFVDDRTDAERATRAAAVHLRELYDVFDDWYLAIAAYNGGVTRVQDAVRSSGSRDFFELSRRGLVPRETSDYVPKFLAVSRIIENPRAHGIRLEPEVAFSGDMSGSSS